MLKKIDAVLDFFEDKSFTLLFSLMTLVVFLQVICRYVIKSSLPWSEEFSRYCMVWVVFIGVSAGIKTGAHMGVDALLMVLPHRFRRMVELLTKVVTLAFCVIFFVVSLKLTIMLFKSGQRSATLFIPIAFAYLAIPVGFIGGIIRSIQLIVAQLQNWHTPEEAHPER